MAPFQEIFQLSKQRKDKEIKKEREELERKRKDFEEIKGKWMKEEQEYKVFSEKRKEENLRLVMQEEGLKRDLFKLSIRKDQIEARSNPTITVDKATIIKKYLKCVPFTAGKRLESIQFWQSQARYTNLRFLLELAVDRFFGRSTIQKAILGNLSRIVFCKKIKFGGQWIMFCIKEPIRAGSRFCCKTSKKSHKSLYHPGNIASSPEERKFELIVYAISGTYFHLNKFYTEEELKSWIDVSAYSEPVPYKHHRLSVADNLAKQNALRVLSENSMMEPNLFQEFRKGSMKQVKDQFKIISEQAVAYSQNSDLNDDTQDENLSQATQQIEQKGSNEDSTPQKTDENISESEAETPTPNLRTRKSVQMKSWFYIRGKNESFACKYNRQFLSGYSSSLFPQKDPLINVVVFKDKKQLYLLQEYIQNASKKQILDMAVARFKLKMKIKAELRKCLYYKKEIIDVCEETTMAEAKQICLPCLFVLKRRETPLAHEIYISCDSLASHPQIQNGLQFKALLHSVVKNKHIKISLLRNRQQKRRSNFGRHQRIASVQHGKFAYGAAQDLAENWFAFSPKIMEKYHQFMSKHIISLKKRCFVPIQEINRTMINFSNSPVLQQQTHTDTLTL